MEPALWYFTLFEFSQIPALLKLTRRRHSSFSPRCRLFTTPGGDFFFLISSPDRCLISGRAESREHHPWGCRRALPSERRCCGFVWVLTPRWSGTEEVERVHRPGEERHRTILVEMLGQRWELHLGKWPACSSVLWEICLVEISFYMAQLFLCNVSIVKMTVESNKIIHHLSSARPGPQRIWNLICMSNKHEVKWSVWWGFGWCL